LPLRRTPKPRAPRPRDREPEPKLSRQFQSATSTLVLRDRRLPPNAARLAGMIVAIAGQRGWFETTRARLGAAVGLRPRTITRLLGDLIRHGYVAAERTKTRMGADAGLRLFVMPRLMPFYVVEDKGWPRGASQVRRPINLDLHESRDLPLSAPFKPPDRDQG
jgi:hypothetical protein